MAQGRTVQHFQRLYIGGYDLSSDAINTGELACAYEIPSEGAMGWEVKGAKPGMCTHSIGDVNALIKTTAGAIGIHDIFPSLAGTWPYVMTPIGIQAAPIIGDPVYVGRFGLSSYAGALGTNLLACNLKFGEEFPGTWSLDYSKPWGHMVHVAGNETAANAANVTDDFGSGAASAYGGWMAWQIFSYTGTGSVILTVEGSANGTTGWAAITGATSGSIAHTVMPLGGMVFLGPTAAVPRYIRWQMALTTLTGLNFALAFGRCTTQGL